MEQFLHNNTLTVRIITVSKSVNCAIERTSFDVYFRPLNVYKIRALDTDAMPYIKCDQMKLVLNI